MACCRCCEQTGACCNAGVCTEETCADCEDAGGVFQGVGTECSGVSLDECPCDPPADPAECQQCVDGVAVTYCPEASPNCCDGVCQEAECAQSCTSASDCPNYGLPCESVFPDVPYNCCDGVCEPHACYPEAVITAQFTKKAGCTAAFLSGVAEGGAFEVQFSGGSISECGVTSVANSGAPCLMQWTLGEGCDVTGFSFSANGDPTCEACYEFTGWSACRGDCSGGCA